LVKQKEEEKKNCQTGGQRKGPLAEASFCLVYSPFLIFKGVHELPSVGIASF
jgi:hypothetical protein